MNLAAWTEELQAIGAIATPVGVAVLAFVLSRRQNRNQELLKTRIDYYKDLVPDLNSLMCYMTFIGPWRDISPPELIDLKRRLDHRFYIAAPLFSTSVLDAYTAFTDQCFKTFRQWGGDPGIRSSAYRRRQAWRRQPGWNTAWEKLFTRADTDVLSGEELASIRRAYDRLVAALVRDLSITRTRHRYTTPLVSLNAYAPAREDIAGRPESD